MMVGRGNGCKGLNKGGFKHHHKRGRISSLLAHRNFSKIIAFLDSSWYVDSESMICFERTLLVDEKFEFKV
jgi:hypothetical protein